MTAQTCSSSYFYPRPPRGGRRPGRRLSAQYQHISIHALREEGDDYLLSVGVSLLYFYPRPPRGGRREQYQNHPATAPISIHALREEGDSLFLRLLCGGFRFLSTPSARRATWRVR